MGRKRRKEGVNITVMISLLFLLFSVVGGDAEASRSQQALMPSIPLTPLPSLRRMDRLPFYHASLSSSSSSSSSLSPPADLPPLSLASLLQDDAQDKASASLTSSSSTSALSMSSPLTIGSAASAAATPLSLFSSIPSPSSGIFRVPLAKGIVGSRRQATLLLQLRMAQRGLKPHEVLADRSDPAVMSFLETSSSTSPSSGSFNVPLESQLLLQKRLATYFGQISIGDNQVFKVLFDTGSCEFWVPANTCAKHTNPEICRKHHKYNPSESKHFHRFSHRKSGGANQANLRGPDDKLEIKYLSGKIEGMLAEDTVHVGQLAVTKQVFGAAEQIDVPLLDEVDWDGILGLAYPSSVLAKRGVNPLFDTIMKESLLHKNVFGYYLGPSGGMMTLGGIDQRLLAPGAEFVYTPVVQKGYWTVGLVDVELIYPGGERFSTGVCKSQPRGYCPTIVDTGTYLVYGPRNILGDKLKDIQTTGCASVKSLPQLVLVLYGGHGKAPIRLTLTPEDYTLRFLLPAANVPSSECTGAQQKTHSSTDARCVPDCLTGIAPDDEEKEMFTLGQVFLRSFYTVFDRDNDAIGFARSVTPGVTHAL